MLDSLQLHGLQPTRLLCPWDSPGRDTGVGCHFLLRGCRRQSLSREYDEGWVILKVITTALLPRQSNWKLVSTFVYCWQVWNRAPGLWLFTGDPLLNSEFISSYCTWLLPALQTTSVLADVMNISTKLCSQRKQKHPEGLELPDCGCIRISTVWGGLFSPSRGLISIFQVLWTDLTAGLKVTSREPKGSPHLLFTGDGCPLVWNTIQFLFRSESELCLAFCLQLIVLTVRLCVHFCLLCCQPRPLPAPSLGVSGRQGACPIQHLPWWVACNACLINVAQCLLLE